MKNGTTDTIASTDLTSLLDTRYAQKVYDQHRSTVSGWTMRRYQLTREEAFEVYQEAFVICYYQVRKGTLTHIRCDTGTYLTGIIKNLMKQRNSARKFMSLEQTGADPAIDNLAESKIQETYNKLQVQKLLEHMKDPCRTILELFYQQQFALEAIAERLGYKNANVVKKKKSLCLKTLRDHFNASDESMK